jgi:hypothetical protein
MSKAKPVSLWPLSFDEALKKLIGTPPPTKSAKPKKKRPRAR